MLHRRLMIRIALTGGIMSHRLFFCPLAIHKRASTCFVSMLAALPLLAALSVSGCESAKPATGTEAQPPTAVRVVGVDERSMQETVEYVGTVDRKSVV